MSVSFNIDTSEVRAFVAELGRMPARTRAALPPIVAKGAVNIKKQLQAEMGASRSFGHLASGISYDLEDGGMTAKIGPHKKYTGQKKAPRRGANIAYFGTYKGGGTVPDPKEALEAEVPAFRKHILDAVEEAI